MRSKSRRNAVIGWVALALAKRVLKRKAKTVTSAVKPKTPKRRKKAVAVVIAGAVGAATFLRMRSGDDAA
jgi:hypothetical protein